MKQIFITLVALILTGCANPTKHFYVLSASGPAPSGGGLGIGVGPVTLAEYIDRPNLIIQQGPNQLSVAEDHRWAGDLSQSIAQVTAVNLGRKLRTGNVMTYPWQRDSEVRYQVTLDVRKLHSGEDGNAVIEAGWRAYALPERRLVASRTFTDQEPLDTDGYPAMVAAESRLLERLADSIARSLR